jgi:hypothetical protein
VLVGSGDQRHLGMGIDAGQPHQLGPALAGSLLGRWAHEPRIIRVCRDPAEQIEQ